MKETRAGEEARVEARREMGPAKGLDEVAVGEGGIGSGFEGVMMGEVGESSESLNAMLAESWKEII